MRENYGLSYVLLVLYRQQIECGFVLTDPLLDETKSKHFLHPEINVNFCLLWNPSRELRNNHEELKKHGIIDEKVDPSKLINKDKSGKACYLCRHNIELQNPKEILLSLNLAGEKYYVGANFAHITNNHFTLMSQKHRNQKYCKNCLVALGDLLDKTDGYFRCIYNGLAGATIPWHEHFQFTNIKFPIEALKGLEYNSTEMKVYKPGYYLPILVVQGTNRKKVEEKADSIIKNWHNLDSIQHSINIIYTKNNGVYTIFIILRDTKKLAGEKKSGGMASFECGGLLVLSHEPQELEIFDNANLDSVKNLLEDIIPKQGCNFIENLK